MLSKTVRASSSSEASGEASASELSAEGGEAEEGEEVREEEEEERRCWVIKVVRSSGSEISGCGGGGWERIWGLRRRRMRRPEVMMCSSELEGAEEGEGEEVGGRWIQEEVSGDAESRWVSWAGRVGQGRYARGCSGGVATACLVLVGRS